MNYISVCSGIEAATVAWEPLGWKPLWFSEVERFCCALLEHYYPDVPNLGDMTKLTEADLERFPQADVLVGGTPCQSFSVAGLRGGLADPRGNLALRFCQLAGVLRPRWVLWENVPGVYSSWTDRETFAPSEESRRLIREAGLDPGDFEEVDQTSDFDRFLAAFSELGYECVYRSLDAEYFGLAQRRKRVFALFYLGDWRSAAAVLLERDSLCGHPPPSRQAGAGVAACFTAGAHPGGHNGQDDHKDGRLIPTTAACLNSGGNDGGFRTEPGEHLVARPLAHGSTANHQDESQQTYIPVAYQCHGSNVGEMGHLRAGNGNETGGVPFVLPAMTTELGVAGAGRLHDQYSVPDGMAVRRLTPRECEKLQGFTPIRDRVIIEVCSDHQNNAVRAGLRCRRLPSSARRAGDDERNVSVSCADATLWSDLESREAIAAVHVRMSHEPRLVAIHNVGKLIWCANGAEQRSEFPLPMLPDDFARAIAAARQGLVPTTPVGKAVLPRPTMPFTLPLSGKWPAAIFGHENEPIVSDVESTQNVDITSTTSSVGLSIPSSGSTETTWLCFALDAIGMCIPTATSPKSSVKLVLDFESDYTKIPYRNKPADDCPDGPRYRALGNSMAVPVIRWLAERMTGVDALARSC